MHYQLVHIIHLRNLGETYKENGIIKTVEMDSCGEDKRRLKMSNH